MNKFLVVGLGNIGDKYRNTRHNIGFKIVDTLVKEYEGSFSAKKLGDIAYIKIKGKMLIVLKPKTYMNLSGKAVLYWIKKERVAIENLLVVADDLNLDFGKIRIKGKGSCGGHNGLKDTQDKLNSVYYPRLRFGVGSNYNKGSQIDFVLGQWNSQEESSLTEHILLCVHAITSFVTTGLVYTMNKFNGK
ncbi:MAG: aminoacyl-tRNA hydrolase [Tenacibaculum sp.]